MSPGGSGAGARAVVVASPGNAPLEDATADAIAAYLGSRAGGEVAAVRVPLVVTAVPQAVVARLAGITPGGVRPRVTGPLGDLAERLAGDAFVECLVAEGVARARAALQHESPAAVIAVGDLTAGLVAECSGEWVAAGVLPILETSDVWVHPGVGMWFVACAEARDSLVMRGVPWDRIALSGVPVAPGAASAPRPASDRFAVSVLAGGEGLRHLVKDIVEVGVRALVPLTEGIGARDAERLAAEVPGVEVVGEADAVRCSLAASHVAVCRAGTPPLAEALCAGRALVVPSAPDDPYVGDAGFLADTGAALPARDDDDVAGRVRFLSTHPERLDSLESAALALGRPDAARAVCERVLAALR